VICLFLLSFLFLSSSSSFSFSSPFLLIVIHLYLFPPVCRHETFLRHTFAETNISEHINDALMSIIMHIKTYTSHTTHGTVAHHTMCVRVNFLCLTARCQLVRMGDGVVEKTTHMITKQH
jgi:hypothetical protein